MKGDFTRLTFRSARHYSTVRLQQGRVQLDADWNEQVDIQTHRDVTATRDAFGPSGAPMHDAGFAVSLLPGNLQIGPGRYYVDGILCENEQSVGLIQSTGLPAQPDLPGAALPTDDGTFLAYLDVWQRHITAVEQNDLREVALNGPDTATRTRTVWQVKLARLGTSNISFACANLATWVPPDSPSTGQLRAQGEPAEDVVDKCLVPPGAGYRRLENQLYRVEIHVAGAPGVAKFKWSRDNGTVLAGLEKIEGNVLTISAPRRDAVLGYAPGQWVELSDEPRTLRGEVGVLVQLALVKGNALTVAGWPGGTPLTMSSFGAGPTVRRWESDGAVTVSTGSWLDLEDGVQVAFSGGQYRVGDYWLIPARSLTGQVEWPRNGAGPLFEGRHGIAHHFSPLALLGFDGTTWTLRSDCRRLFPPATELISFFYVSGAGQEAMPGQDLREPLVVGVSNGQWPVAGARVQFKIIEGSGTLKAGASTSPTDLVLQTDAQGLAECSWQLDAVTLSQRVEATLLDDAGNALHLPIRFNANLSVASEVAYTPPGGCGGLAGITTVQDALDSLSKASHLFYVSGDGQEATPDPLQPGNRVSVGQPLQVGVTSDCGLMQGATVRFHLTVGNGRIKPTAQQAAAFTNQPVDIVTGADGLAICDWELDATTQDQQVEAQLTDGSGNPVGLPVRFNASLSVASEVAYDPGNCQGLAGTNTVQEALDRLARLPALFYVGGLGQEAMPDPTQPQQLLALANPLQAGVVSQCGLVAGAKVRFHVIQGNGRLNGTGSSVDLPTGADGLASCTWELDSATPTQQVEARLLDANGQPVNLPLRFVATLSMANRVSYTPGACQKLANARTVQDALDELCKTGPAATEEGVHISRVLLGSAALRNDTNVPVVSLISAGITVVCDQPVDAGSISRPTCFVTLEMPFPCNAADREIWGNPVVGYQPLHVDAIVIREEADNHMISWRPTEPAAFWLNTLLFPTLKKNNLGNRLLVRFTLKGNFIWAAEKPNLYLDGEAFGVRLPDHKNTDIDLSKGSGDGRRGGDFEMWFWLVEQ